MVWPICEPSTGNFITMLDCDGENADASWFTACRLLPWQCARVRRIRSDVVTLDVPKTMMAAP